MNEIIETLRKNNLIQVPSWLPSNIHYETIMGSVAYGVSSDNSDNDIYGFCIPPKSEVFPHLDGYIDGFGTKRNPFTIWNTQKSVEFNTNSYDITMYSIVRYFNLCMENNPNMIDSLFTPTRCVLQISPIGEMVRDRRKMFLHKGAWHKFKGYAFSQLGRIRKGTQNKERIKNMDAITKFEECHEIDRKTGYEEVRSEFYAIKKGGLPSNNKLANLSINDLGKYFELYTSLVNSNRRDEWVKRYGMDVKFAYHVVRLINEVEQILTEGNLDLERNREQLKSIRNGEWSFDRIDKWFTEKERSLETIYNESKLPYGPDENAIKSLLMECLEHHYGDLSTAVSMDVNVESMIGELETVLQKYKR